MATLRDLCKDVPQAIDRMAVERELVRRKNASYLKRMGELRAEENVFGNCQQQAHGRSKMVNIQHKSLFVFYTEQSWLQQILEIEFLILSPVVRQQVLQQT